MKITAAQRPYHLTIGQTTYPLTSVEAQRLIDAYPARVMRHGHAVAIMTGQDAASVSLITPATLGGGIAFTVSR